MRLKTGDIFSIEIDNERLGFGQILQKLKYSLFIIVFEESYNKNNIPQLSGIIKPVPLLMGCTLTGLLYDGEDWKVIGNYKESVNSYPYPFYKEGLSPNEIFIVDYKGERVRESTAAETASLDYRSVIAPIYFEEALKAYHKLLPWSASYDEILYKNVLRKSFSIL